MHAKLATSATVLVPRLNVLSTPIPQQVLHTVPRALLRPFLSPALHLLALVLQYAGTVNVVVVKVVMMGTLSVETVVLPPALLRAGTTALEGLAPPKIPAQPKLLVAMAGKLQVKAVMMRIQSMETAAPPSVSSKRGIPAVVARLQQETLVAGALLATSAREVFPPFALQELGLR